MNKLSITSIVVAIISLIVATVAVMVAVMSDSDKSTTESRAEQSPQNPNTLGGGEMPTSQNYVEQAGCDLNMKMVYVAGGTFQMGATSEQDGAYENEKPVHTVTLNSYYIGECEVTQAQWEKVMGTDPSYFKGENRPVECVSWNDAQAFCQALSRLTGKRYVLPTEAQWEYAARGGKKGYGSLYSGSFAIDKVAWYGGNSGNRTHSVKQKQPNELGLYDMSGNVVEWCSDWYGSYSSDSQRNPQGPSSGSKRVTRGGCWGNRARDCRVSIRDGTNQSRCNYGIGFRVVRLP